MKLDIKAFSLTCALVWGFGLFFLTWWIIAFDGTTIDPTFIGKVYRGYTLSPIGSFIGLAWALADGAIGGGDLCLDLQPPCGRCRETIAWRGEQ